MIYAYKDIEDVFGYSKTFLLDLIKANCFPIQSFGKGKTARWLKIDIDAYLGFLTNNLTIDTSLISKPRLNEIKICAENFKKRTA